MPLSASTDAEQLLCTVGRVSPSHRQCPMGRSQGGEGETAATVLLPQGRSVSLLFLTVGKSFLPVSQHCPLLQSTSCARKRYRSSPVAGRETEAGSSPHCLPLVKTVSMKHPVPLQHLV